MHEDTPITEFDSEESNMLYTDGRSPSEWTNDDFTGYEDCCTAGFEDFCPVSTEEEEEEEEESEIEFPRGYDERFDIWEYNPSITPTRSLWDSIKMSESITQVFVFIWYNPWTLVIWISWCELTGC